MNWVTVTINGSEVSVAFDENSIHIYNAYPIKDDLKMRGYRWNPSDKSWYIRPVNVDGELSELKNEPADPDPGEPNAVRPTGTPGTGSDIAQFPESCSVADLRNRIDRLIREGIRGNVWVRGVIASDVKNYKWASYLDLKDENEKRDIFFRVDVKKQHLEKINRKLKESGVAEALEKDLPVFCNVEVYLPLRNVIDVRLSLLDILPEYTQSKIRNQREITLDALKQEGVLDNQKQLILPALISRVGLITSGQGTSVRDIKAGLHPFGGKYDVYFIDSRMEGAHAVESIIRSVDYLENHAGISLDALVIARGGGSEQSLAVFNDLRLCRRVCTSRIPILTAIGHEKDVSAIEMCSRLTPTPSTPSGIGKYLQDRYLGLQDRLAGSVTRLIHHFSTVHQGEMEKIKSFLKNIPARAAGYLRLREERFFAMARGLERSVAFTVRDQERRLDTLARRLLQNCRDLRARHEKSIRATAGQLHVRTTSRRRRERKELEKTILRFDFEKRRRENRANREALRKQAGIVLERAVKKLADAQKDLDADVRLVRAGDLENILKKGFTLTLDDDNRVIKSVGEFNRKERAVLKFHDGSTEIIKK